MKRRTFAIAAAAVMPAAFLAALPARAQYNFAPGRGYKVVTPPAPTSAPAGKIEVVEFFSYGCPHCMRFEPVFEQWKQSAPKDVVVRRIHVGVGFGQFEPLQRIYYALVALGAPDTIQPKIFDAFQNKRLRLDQPDVLFPWIAQQGIDRAKFEQAYNSFGMPNLIRQSNQLQEAYKVEGTPALGIAGRFYTDPTCASPSPSTSEADAFRDMIRVTDSLIDLSRKGGGAAGKLPS